MVGGRHDRAFCACGGEETSEGRERMAEGGGRERELQSERSSIIRHSSPQLRAASLQHEIKKMSETTAHARTAVYSGTHSHLNLCENV